MIIDIPAEYLDKAVRESLIEAYDSCAEDKNLLDYDAELLNSFKRVIEHYSSPEDYEDWLSSVEPIIGEPLSKAADTYKKNMKTDRTFIAEASSPGNAWKGKVVIRAANIVEAQDKFFAWLRKQEVYTHMWKLHMDIYEGDHDPIEII